MSSFQYYELDTEGSLPFLELEPGEEKPVCYQITIPEVYPEPKRTIKCIGISDSLKYQKYTVTYQEYATDEGKRSTRPSYNIKTKKASIYKPVNMNCIIIKGKKDTIGSTVEMLTKHDMLKVKHYSVNILKYCMDYGIDYSIAWTSGSTGSHGHYRAYGSDEDILTEAVIKGWTASSVTYPMDNDEDGPKIQINSSGNIYIYRNLEEEDELDIVSKVIKKLHMYMIPTEV